MSQQLELVSRMISAIKDQMASISESAMLMPKMEPFHHGVTVGQYQGLKQALDTIDAILRDDYQQEINS